jgi:hypothetical protein
MINVACISFRSSESHLKHNEAPLPRRPLVPRAAPRRGAAEDRGGGAKGSAAAVETDAGEACQWKIGEIHGEIPGEIEIYEEIYEISWVNNRFNRFIHIFWGIDVNFVAQGKSQLFIH